VSEPRAKAILGMAAFAAVASCGFLSTIGPAPALLSDKAVERFDFEQDALSSTPQGFEPRRGRWAVVDSPTSLSGTQVLVRSGEAPALLAVKSAEQVRAAAGEVGVRVVLGSSGAGVGCQDERAGSGHFLKVEPDAGRVALYRKNGESLALADEAPTSVPKGDWARIGILCDQNRVIGYVDGKPLLRDRATAGSFELALVADGGVTVQFDDLAYWAKK
jgi:hypothetical protein